MSLQSQFVFDPKRCTGCEACVVACWMENRAQQTQPWRRVHTFNGQRVPGLPVRHLSLACHHCDHPACLENCPASAYTRDPATGAVLLQPEHCMGCRYCTWACPHDAPKFSAELGTVEKCTFCQSRLSQGLEPACAARCPVQALSVEPRTSYKGPTPPGFPVSDLEPGIRFQAGSRPAPVQTAPGIALASQLRSLLQVPEPKISLRGEWTLVVFTSILATLAGTMGAAGAGRPVRHPWLLLGAGVLAMLLSAWHLGRPERAWRAVLNLRNSWLSREIVLVSGFLGLAGLSLGVHPHSRPLTWLAALAGMAALFAVDRVYQLAVQVGPLNFHSAHCLFNGLYLMGILAGWWPLALLMGLLKAGLYLVRKAYFRGQGRGVHPGLSALRLAAGFLLPALAMGSGLGAAGAILGDLLDRCEYYGELEIPSPAGALVRDLAAKLT